MSTSLKPTRGMQFESGKTYTHAQGLSCCFRQWRAIHSHCRFLHGYALQVSITFSAAELDDRNWVMDFGGLKHIKQWLEDTFDHKTLVAKDDPAIEHIREHSKQFQADPNWVLHDMVIMDHVGCEAFAKMIYDYVNNWRFKENHYKVQVECVEVREHEGNFARYRRL